jgi:hypothetical protein
MKKKIKKPRTKRPLNTGPKSTIGQARSALYRKTLKRVKEAREVGFVLEAVTLLESVISDRLEARLEKLGMECEGGGTFWPLTGMANTLAKRSQDPGEAKAVYARVPIWAKNRNKALHGLGKLAKVQEDGWDQKYAKAQEAAEDGVALFRDLDKVVKKLNRHS